MPNTASSTLTDQQQRILDWITDFIFARGFPPVIREVCEEFGFTSPNGARCHLQALVAKRRLRRVAYRHSGERRVVYLPTMPAIRVTASDRGGVLVGTIGGPVAFTHVAWVAWLKLQLAAEGV